MESNQVPSGLMELPVEIRCIIWRLLVGDRRIHAYCWENVELGNTWESNLCVDSSTPSQLQAYFRSSKHLAPEQEDCRWRSLNNHDWDSCDSRYAHRHNTYGRPRCSYPLFRDGKAVDDTTSRAFRLHVRTLPLLCRIAHQEVTHVLYNTNSFSLWDAYDTSHFLAGRTEFQKRCISTLELQAFWIQEASTQVSQAYIWSRPLSHESIRQLSGLRRVHLVLSESTLKSEIGKEVNGTTLLAGSDNNTGIAIVIVGTEEPNPQQLFSLDEALELFGRLSTLSLTEVTVVVSCTGHIHDNLVYKQELTQRERVRLADRFLHAIQNGHEASIAETKDSEIGE